MRRLLAALAVAALVAPAAAQTPSQLYESVGPGQTPYKTFFTAGYGGSLPESLGATLRRLAGDAAASNPVTAAPLIGSKPWLPYVGAWTASTSVTQGALWSISGGLYVAAVGGTTAATIPAVSTSRNAEFSDGTVTWIYYGLGVGDQVSTAAGQVFQVVTAGNPATSGTGPTPAALTDGTITWQFVGAQTAPRITLKSAHNATYSNQYSPTQGLAAYALIPDGSGVIRYEGGTPAVMNNGAITAVFGPNIGTQTGNCNTATSLIGNQFNCNYVSGTFAAEASVVELWISGNNAVNVLVDGQYVDARFPANPWTFYVNNYVTLDFTNVGGRKARRITIEGGSVAANIRNIAVAANDHVSYPLTTDNFGVAFFGSSLSTGTNASSNANGWNNKFRRLVGLPDSATFGIGSTGVINSGTYINYPAHTLGDLANYTSFRGAPKIIFVEGDINDVSLYSASAITAATLTYLQSIRAAYPLALIVGVGSVNTGAGPCGTALQCEAAFQAAFTALSSAGDARIGFLPNYGRADGAIIYGNTPTTGNATDGSCPASNATGSGNAALDTAATGPHLNDCGYLEWAQGLADEWRAFINTLP